MEFERKADYGPPVESNYANLLKLPEWIDRREELLVSQISSCELCGKSDNGIEIHHKYYIRGRFPWEYPDNSFMILCSSCHIAYHKLKEVPIYNDIDVKYSYKQAFDDISFTNDYYTGKLGFQFFMQKNRVVFVNFGDELSIWLCDAKRTIGQLIRKLNLSVLTLPSSPGKIYKKSFSIDHVEFYIEGWSKDAFLDIQRKKDLL